MRSSSGKYLMAYWNPNDIKVKTQGMAGYLNYRLPNEIDKAVEVVIQHNHQLK